MKFKAGIFFILIFIINSIHAFSQEGMTTPSFHDQFSKKSGNLRMSSSKFDLGTIKNNELKNDTIRFFNSGKMPMNIIVNTNLPSYLKLTLSNTTIKPNSQAYIALSYDASKKNDYGFVMDRIQLITDDEIQPQKFLMVAVYILEFFPPPVDGDSSKPLSRIPETSFDFGKIKQGDKVGHDFKIFNDGNKVLILHKTKANCECIKTTMMKKEIQPGDFSILHIDFDSKGKEGKDSRKISLFINDPANPEVIFEINGEVIK